MTNTIGDSPQPTNPYSPTLPPDEPGRPVVMGHPTQPVKKDSWKSVISTVAILLLAPLVALLLTMFVFQSYQVEGPSMQPTLQSNDRLIVWKLPRTWARITGHPYQPARGDIIVFTEPNLEYYNQAADKQLIKRVIAFPGERVVVKDGTLTVYNESHPDGFHPDDSMPYGATIPDTPHDVDTTVPDGQIFVCGDNRPESLDSRYFGPISMDHIVGKLSYRVLPLNQVKGF